MTEPSVAAFCARRNAENRGKRWHVNDVMKACRVEEADLRRIVTMSDRLYFKSKMVCWKQGRKEDFAVHKALLAGIGNKRHQFEADVALVCPELIARSALHGWLKRMAGTWTSGPQQRIGGRRVRFYRLTAEAQKRVKDGSTVLKSIAKMAKAGLYRFDAYQPIGEKWGSDDETASQPKDVKRAKVGRGGALHGTLEGL